MPNGPIVVVTGANRGIGLEISRQLATRGAEVVLTARKSGAGKAAVKRLAAENLSVQFRPLDVTSGKSIVALREFLKRTYGRLDVLINNAGIIANSDAPGLKVDMETVRVTLETNALGPFHLSQALAPLLRRSKRARIVNISSGMAEKVLERLATSDRTTCRAEPRGLIRSGLATAMSAIPTRLGRYRAAADGVVHVLMAILS
jgi:NAD(P)-dependent dehydrogenase (short-subunit alcohol dehydrogenase family)